MALGVQEICPSLRVDRQRRAERAPLDPGDRVQEVGVPLLAAELPVGRRLQPGVLLQLDRVPDRRVLDGGAASAASILPAAKSSRAACSAAGRSSDPTWSARNGGVARSVIDLLSSSVGECHEANCPRAALATCREIPREMWRDSEQAVGQAEVHPRDLGGDDVVPGGDVPEVDGAVPEVALHRGAALGRRGRGRAEQLGRRLDRHPGGDLDHRVHRGVVLAGERLARSGASARPAPCTAGRTG